MNNILITGGRIVDAANHFDSVSEMLVSEGMVVECSSKISKTRDTRVIDATGKLVIPGLVDSHVHVSGGVEGFYMLAHAGVTSALDMMGYPEETIPYLERSNTGLTLAFLYPLLPERTVSSTEPDTIELREVITKALSNGAFGIKIIGGHYPLTPETQRRTLEICEEMGCYCAIHAGSTEKGSNIEGLEELVGLAEDLPIHIAHINSYCRGQITGNPVEEAGHALNLISKMKNVRSESYLDLINGTSSRIQDGIPLSNVTKNCLIARNYPVTEAGLEDAVRDGWAQVHGKRGNEIVLLPPEEGYNYFQESGKKVMLSFAVNSPGAAIGIATAKNQGKFIVNALSTDGGNIPRNTTLAKALPLVKFGALTMIEFVEKACFAPAQMIGLNQKGHFSIGADADITIVDPDTAKVDYVISGGRIVFHNNQFYPAKGKLITFKR